MTNKVERVASTIILICTVATFLAAPFADDTQNCSTAHYNYADWVGVTSLGIIALTAVFLAVYIFTKYPDDKA